MKPTNSCQKGFLLLDILIGLALLSMAIFVLARTVESGAFGFRHDQKTNELVEQVQSIWVAFVTKTDTFTGSTGFDENWAYEIERSEKGFDLAVINAPSSNRDKQKDKTFFMARRSK